jgi:hypothetical protein
MEIGNTIEVCKNGRGCFEAEIISFCQVDGEPWLVLQCPAGSYNGGYWLDVVAVPKSHCREVTNDLG